MNNIGIKHIFYINIFKCQTKKKNYSNIYWAYYWPIQNLNIFTLADQWTAEGRPFRITVGHFKEKADHYKILLHH